MKNTIKKILSWIVLFVCIAAFFYISVYFFNILTIVYKSIVNLNKVLFWSTAVLGGAISLLIVILGIAKGSEYTVKASQSVFPSNKGVRYTVFAIIFDIPVLSTLAECFVGRYDSIGYVGRIVLPCAIIISIIYSSFVIVFGQKLTKKPTKKPVVKTAKNFNEEQK